MKNDANKSEIPTTKADHAASGTKSDPRQSDIAPKTEAKRIHETRPEASSLAVSRLAGLRRERKDIPLVDIVPKDVNRSINESSERFLSLADSLRVLGLLYAPHVWQRPDGTYELVDGERRWRAARTIGLPAIACEVWPEQITRSDLEVLGLAMNGHREEHSCLDVARQLRTLRNHHVETQEQIAARTGLPLSRVKNYLNLFNASDLLFRFFEDNDMPLDTAVELIRYEKAAGEVAARQLIRRHREEPLTGRFIEALRKKEQAIANPDKALEPEPPAKKRRGPSPASRAVAKLQVAWKEDPAVTRRLVEELVAKVGLRLVDVESAVGRVP